MLHNLKANQVKKILEQAMQQGIVTEFSMGGYPPLEHHDYEPYVDSGGEIEWRVPKKRKYVKFNITAIFEVEDEFTE